MKDLVKAKRSMLGVKWACSAEGNRLSRVELVLRIFLISGQAISMLKVGQML